MEKHIFKFGESSVAMIVPKKWADKNGLKASGTVHVSENELGNLIISAKGSSKMEAEKVVSSRTKPTFIGRWVGLHYQYGVAKLRLYSADGLTHAQTEEVERKINGECPGYEITSQSNKDVIIEDFTNMKEVDIGKIVKRLRSLVNQEFREMLEGDPKTIAKIERLVNRFYMLGMRYVNITQAKDDLKYFGILRSLETISDRLDMLSEIKEARKKAIFEQLGRQFDESFKGLEGDSKAIESLAEGREAVHAQIIRARLDKLSTYLLKDISNNISAIAEYGLKSEGEEKPFL
jgi:hypothetical protein